MMGLENRISEVVKKYLPASSTADQLQIAAFLTVECWNLINETVYVLRKQEIARLKMQGGTRKRKEGADNEQSL